MSGAAGGDGGGANLSESEIHTVSIALTVGKRNNQRAVGAAVHRRRARSGDDDPVLYTLELFDFLDNEQLSNLDSFLVQMGPCVLYVSDEHEDVHRGDGKKLHLLCEGKDIEKVLVKKSLFAKKGGAAALAKLCVQDALNKTHSHAVNVAEAERPLGHSCIDVLVASLRLLDTSSSSSSSSSGDDAGNSGSGHLGHYELRLGALDAHMTLDSAAAEAVNLLPKPDHPSQFGSIYGVLNRCKSKMGSRLLERWLRQPLVDAAEINARLDVVEILKLNTSARTQLYDGALKGVPDLDQVIAKMQKKTAGLAEVFKLYTFTRALPKVLAVLADVVDTCEAQGQGSGPSPDDDGDLGASSGAQVPAARRDAVLHSVRSRLIAPLESLAGKFALYQQLVEHVLDLDQLPDLVVNPLHDPDLQELHQEQQGLQAQADALLRDARNNWASFTDPKLEVNAKDGFVFRTTRAEDERQLRENHRGVRIVSILKNGVYFTTPQLEKVADRYKDIEAEYAEGAKALVASAVGTATTYLPVVEAAATVIAELDVLASFATAAALTPRDYVRPTVLPRGGGVLRLRGARHPCVECMDAVDFIANDYELARGASNYQLITGPNMGGKSTYIRGIGAIVVMAQVGSFVPCDEAEFSVVDKVLARVGAGDAVQKGVSTFMAEMLEASVILETATRDSLIIIDELGRGTSTFDGFGIAWAISEYLVTNVDCMCLFATHFHELTALAAQHQGVVNRHVSAIVKNKAAAGQGATSASASASASAADEAGFGSEVVMLYRVEDGPCTQSFGIHVAGTAKFPAPVIAEAKRKALELEGPGSADDASEAAAGKRQRVTTAMTAFAGRTVASFVAAAAANTLRSEMRAMFPVQPVPVAV